jgi:hypothetical protein
MPQITNKAPSQGTRAKVNNGRDSEQQAYLQSSEQVAATVETDPENGRT